MQQAREAYEKSEALESGLSEHQQTLIRNNDLGSVLKSLKLHIAFFSMLLAQLHDSFIIRISLLVLVCLNFKQSR